MKKLAAMAGLAIALSGCSVVKVPERFVGTWASDCSQPFIRFERMGKIHVFPDGADYRLKAAKFTGSYLIVTYRVPKSKGDMTDTYLVTDNTIKLTKSVLLGVEANWDKQPMFRCTGP